MNWSDVGASIVKFAPLAGAALSSPVGAAIGVGTIIANLFGVDAKPEKVLDYINENPNQAEEKLKFEMGNNIELQKLIIEADKERNRHEEQDKAIEFQNTDSARNNSANVNDSPVDNKIKMMLVVGKFLIIFTCIIAYIFFHSDMNQSVVVTLGTIAGATGADLGSMVNFYWGTSFGSQRKDDIIAKK